MDQGLGSQRRLNFLSVGMIVIKVVGCGSIASCLNSCICVGSVVNMHHVEVKVVDLIPS